MQASISSSAAVADRVVHALFPKKQGTIVAVRLHSSHRRDHAEFYSFEYDVQWDDWPEEELSTCLYYGVTIIKIEAAL